MNDARVLWIAVDPASLRVLELARKVAEAGTGCGCGSGCGCGTSATREYDPITKELYSAEEVGHIALQCPEHDVYHVMAENLLVEVLRDDGLPVRVIFDRVPPNLRAKPTLSVTVDADVHDQSGALVTTKVGPGTTRANNGMNLINEKNHISVLF